MNSNPIRLLVHGATGRMGKALIRLAAGDARLAVVAAVSRSGEPSADASVPSFRADAIGAWPAFDVAVDFSLPEGFDRLLDACRQRGAALVSGTTGLEGRQQMHLAEASSDIPVLWASNFSLGVVVLHELVRKVSASLPDWDVAIVETHHVHKLDAPSGTALTLGKAASEASGRKPAIESIRQGEVIGEHVVRFSGAGETLELSHRASDRDIFARGALEAARRLALQPAGQFSLAELLALES
ncbi:MAG: 4-hydroxy-tetrahydrodipicolinate reductase [Gammaproteobacteria bacterium]|nr:4-hydroxy-tetrahydrodipicolinate reductase [Gammaproteobacteria bacterium]